MYKRALQPTPVKVNVGAAGIAVAEPSESGAAAADSDCAGGGGKDGLLGDGGEAPATGMKTSSPAANGSSG
jgi:hypothetical protein